MPVLTMVRTGATMGTGEPDAHYRTILQFELSKGEYNANRYRSGYP
ncbi:hypothetical protein [Rhizobium sp. Root1203]|jgi:hypothetical protein|nr:hypothetical protein [Rhizobium sp. Root1203]